MAGRTFLLDEETLMRLRVGALLALDERAIGQTLPLFASLDEANAAPQPNANGVAVVQIDGPIGQRAQENPCGTSDGYDAIVARIGAALDDPSVGAVVMRINSPGGDAAGMLEALRRISGMIATSGKAVYAFLDEQGTSAAYAIACAATAGIYMAPEGAAGSIGIFGMHVDTSAKLAAKGIVPTAFRYPPGKNTATAVEPLSDDAKAEMSARVETLAKSFAAAVASARGLTTDGVVALNGAVLYGADAVKAGLVDGLASFEQVLGKAATMAATRAPRAQGVSPMNRTSPQFAAVLTLLGLSAAASDEEVALKATEAAPLLALGKFALEHTGATSPDAARGVIEARAKDAKATADLRASAEKQTKEIADRDRISALEAAIVAGKITPGEAWKDGTKALGPSDWYASRSAEEIKAYAATKAPAMPIESAATPTAPTGAATSKVVMVAGKSVTLDALDLSICADAKCDLNDYAALKAQRDSVRATGGN